MWSGLKSLDPELERLTIKATRGRGFAARGPPPIATPTEED